MVAMPMAVPMPLGPMVMMIMIVVGVIAVVVIVVVVRVGHDPPMSHRPRAGSMRR